MVLSRRSHTQKATQCGIPFMFHSRKGITIGQKVISDCQGLGVRRGADNKGAGGNWRATKLSALFCV